MTSWPSSFLGGLNSKRIRPANRNRFLCPSELAGLA
jgi:hypothetical protein